MKTQSPDTSWDAEQVQITALRRMGVKGRLARMRSLTRSTQKLARQAFRKARPNLNEQELTREWVRLNYGIELPARSGNDS